MILLNGRIHDHRQYQKVMGELKDSIYAALNKPQLAADRVQDAIGRFLDDLLKGKFDEELSQTAGEVLSHKQEWADKVSREMGNSKSEPRDYIADKYRLELGNWKEELERDGKRKVVPVGVLLHIPAGNMEVLPIYSVLEGLLSGNINLVKLPGADNGITVQLLLKLISYEPELASYIAVFDTPSTDFETIKQLMELANAVAIWGGDEAVQAVRNYAPLNTKLIEWGHKLSFAYLDRPEVETDQLEALARHIIDTKQLLCSSCQVIYVNTESFEEVCKVGEEFSRILEKVSHSQSLSAKKEPSWEEYALLGKVKLELRTRKLEQMLGRYPDEIIYEGESTSVICKRDQELELSLLCGNVYMKPLPRKDIVRSLYKQRGYLQTVGIYGNSPELTELFTRIGITQITEIDKMSESVFAGAHDGRMALQEYSRVVELRAGS